VPPDNVDGETLELESHRYPLMRLSQYLDLPAAAAPADEKISVLLARMGAQQVAIQVDNLVDTREIVIKPLGAQLQEISAISGATILGDGSVVLILDIAELWEMRRNELLSTPAKISPVESEPRAPVVMVVDDSLTVRKVTSRSLTKQGFEVILAKDGVDAMEKLEETIPAVMLIDIEMPRMDGYELTNKIRSDPRTADVPIIIITSRAGPRHRQKAMELGANAYLTKPYQEHDLMAHVAEMLDRAPADVAPVVEA